MWRVVTKDIKLGDVNLEAGYLVMLRFDAANRDHSIYRWVKSTYGETRKGHV